MMAKLVRDRIPEIIRSSGRAPEVRRASGDELKEALKEKLVEEARELRKADDIYGELADVLEVVDAIVEYYNIDRSKLEEAKKKKLNLTGGFKEGYILSEEKRTE